MRYKRPRHCCVGDRLITAFVLHAEHRQQTPDVLLELSAHVLLLDEGEDAAVCRRNHSNDAAVADFGISMEQLSLRVQREIWSALASGASPNENAAVSLARAFLRVAAQPRRRENDAVCLSLARMVLSGVTGEVESEGGQMSTTTEAAFRRRMRRLTLSRVKFPSSQDGDDKVGFTGLQQTFSSSVAAESMRTSSRVTKRPRAEIPEDQHPSKTEQSSRSNTPAPMPLTAKIQERPPLTKEVCETGICSRRTLHVDSNPLSTLVFLVDGRSRIRTVQAAGSTATFRYLSSG